MISSFIGEDSPETASDLFYREVMAESLRDLIAGLIAQDLVVYRPAAVSL
ncbi:MAG: hypothetical protein IT210_21805 [Armatimonadetes bacterium]|nr:hypothetical protein [Armatimonadota bacterium]